jgi:hypothetical protein
MAATWEIVFAISMLVFLFAKLEGAPVFQREDDNLRRFNVIAFWSVLAMIVGAVVVRPMPGRRSNEYSW